MSPTSISITIVTSFIILFATSLIAERIADNEGFFVGQITITFLSIFLFYRMNLVSI